MYRREELQRLKNLRRLRERKALTQQEVADLAGISLGSYCCLERLENGPRPTTARKLAEVFGVEPYELWEGDDYMDYSEMEERARPPKIRPGVDWSSARPTGTYAELMDENLGW